MLTPTLSQAAFFVLDAGHGGADPGATLNGVKESEIVMTITHHLKAELEAKGHKITLTRQGDHNRALEDRARQLNSLAAAQQLPDLFLSLHVNSSQDTSIRGFEAYIQNQLPLDEETLIFADRDRAVIEGHGHDVGADGHDVERVKKASLVQAERHVVQHILNRGALAPQTTKAQLSDLRGILADTSRAATVSKSAAFAKAIVREWRASRPFTARPPQASNQVVSKATKVNHRAASVRQAPFFLLTHTSAPSVLLEIGYLTHPHEGGLLQSQINQKKAAQSIATALDQAVKNFTSDL